MRVRIDGETRTGRAIDLREFDADFRGFDADFRGLEVDPTTVAAAIRGAADENCPVAVECPDPGPVHDHVGVLAATTTVSRRVALAAAARSRGHAAPQADELADVRERLADLDPSGVDLSTARKRVADASEVETGLRERVATLQGRVQALRDAGDAGTVEDVEADLADATRRLSEVQTERIAAEQSLARAREEARTTRATRRERLRLEDRAGNLRRDAREWLASRVSEEFEAAREAIPGGVNRGESVETVLALARVADLDAPVVLAREVDCFESLDDASCWLDSAVVRV